MSVRNMKKRQKNRQILTNHKKLLGTKGIIISKKCHCLILLDWNVMKN